MRPREAAGTRAGRAGRPARPSSSSASASASWRAARPRRSARRAAADSPRAPIRRAMGTAHSSPMVSGCTRWNRRTKRCRVSRLEAAVGVSDERPGEAEHARIPLQSAFRELGELAIEPGREILPDLPNDLVDDVEVVDEPLRGRRDRAFLPDHRGERSIALEQNTPAVPHARRQGAADPALEQGRAGARSALRAPRVVRR